MWDSFWSLSAHCQLPWVYTLMRQLQSLLSVWLLFISLALNRNHWFGASASLSKTLNSWADSIKEACVHQKHQTRNLNSIPFPAIFYFNCELRLFSPQPLHQQKVFLTIAMGSIKGNTLLLPHPRSYKNHLSFTTIFIARLILKWSA